MIVAAGLELLMMMMIDILNGSVQDPETCQQSSWSHCWVVFKSFYATHP